MRTREIAVWPLAVADANLNTATIDPDGVVWFTGQRDRRSPRSGQRRGGGVAAPRGPGPYGIDATPDGDIYFASLAGSYLGKIDRGRGRCA